jgi:hypothetical protein
MTQKSCEIDAPSSDPLDMKRKQPLRPEVEILLRTEEFDLIIVSARLSESEKGRILSAVGETPTYVLHGLTLVAELLSEVERLLPPARPRLPWSGPPCH